MAGEGTGQSFGRLTGVEGWRGVAGITVVSFHVWMNMGRDGSGLGPGLDHAALAWTAQNVDVVVDLFFVLSGMLLWLPFAAAAFDDRVEVPHGGAFFGRRALRLLPLYLVVVLIEWSLRNYDVATADWIDLAEHLTLTQSLDSKRIFYTIGPAWTLSVEWFFYLAMALLAPRFARWIRRAASPTGRVVRFLAGTLPVLLGSLGYKYVVAHVLEVPVTDWAWRFGPVAKADTFVVGMYFGTLTLALGRRRIPAPFLPLAVAGAGASYWMVRVPPGADHGLHDQVIRHTVAAFAFGLILFALATSRWQGPARLVDSRIMLSLSALTYSIYLVHEGVLDWTKRHGWFAYTPTLSTYVYDAALVLALSFPIAYLFHRFVELPWANTAWLLNRDGSARELYPDLTAHPESRRPQRVLSLPRAIAAIPPSTVLAGRMAATGATRLPSQTPEEGAL